VESRSSRSYHENHNVIQIRIECVFNIIGCIAGKTRAQLTTTDEKVTREREEHDNGETVGEVDQVTRNTGG